MVVTQPMTGRLMCPEIATETWVTRTKGGKQVSIKHLCPHHPITLHRRSLVEAETTQSHTILSSASSLRHQTTRTRRHSVPTRALTIIPQLAGDTQNPNNRKIPGPLQTMDGKKTMGRVTRTMRTTSGRQTKGGLIPVAVGVNSLIPRHGPMLYLRIPLVPKQRRMHMHRPVEDGKAGGRKREDYPR